MAFKDKVPSSIADLNADCLCEIFSYLKLLEILNLRSHCSVLNDAVLKHIFFTTNVSILYTEHEESQERLSPSSKLARIQSSSHSEPWLGPPFSQTIRGLLDQTLENCSQKPPFQSEGFFIISGNRKYAEFIGFVRKYLPNIQKLALIIDPNPSEFPVLSVATDLLKVCSKVETLFLERTDRIPNEVPSKILFKVDDLGRLLVTIAELPMLSELHFFARRTSEINLATFDDRYPIFNDLPQTIIGHFLLKMLSKLRIFRLNHFCYRPFGDEFSSPSIYLDPVLGRSFGDILELGSEENDCFRLTNSGTVFKKLHTLTFFGYKYSSTNNFECFDAYNIGNSFQQLKTLQFTHILKLNNQTMLNLNALPNLEKLTAQSIRWVDRNNPRIIIIYGEYEEYDREEYENVNKTIKHIQVKAVDRKYPTSYAFTDFFQSLQSVTVWLPEMVVYERGSFMDIQIRHDHYG